ncbi:phosphatase PAP2 family protein [Actinocorallia sp. A-T 12471]|uniref:phosphatase PAP2 family protein n=1 Tax=Actinocorallia sp. A-T 12471 TaxID=3089813 RepID=UPI0029D3CA08|nr:phosphatase PAP2 family protein [Actinocorallia sp. A-T 12471]MDX6744219.1 phosphatase PAP2 family protein [Actinocorallia sp. A-T 12471]
MASFGANPTKRGCPCSKLARTPPRRPGWSPDVLAGTDLATPTRTTPGPPYTALGVLLAFLTLLVAAEGGPVKLDLLLHDWALDQRTPWADTCAALLTATGVGLPALLLALLAGTVIAGPYASPRRRVASALIAAGILVAGAVVRRGFAELVARARPPGEAWAVLASGHAFPSGHTTSATIVAVLLAAAFPRPSARLLIATWAITVGLTRIWLGVHWPTDVLAGWCLGLLWTTTTLPLLLHPAPTPSANPSTHLAPAHPALAPSADPPLAEHPAASPPSATPANIAVGRVPAEPAGPAARRVR